jgi:glutamate N-acetyltransferase/amino-acid N-acetyltransferase
MAVNLSQPGEIANVPGVRLASGAAAIKSPDRDDLALFALQPGSTVSGVFTQSSFRAAPVIAAEQNLALGAPLALLINSGNANAATGEAGLEDARRLCAEVASVLSADPTQVLPFSTGVIGERLPVERMLPAIAPLADRLDEGGWLDAAQAIMTTDTVPKAVSASTGIDGAEVTVSGIAKGSGMIRPDMATMLAFVCTDAAVAADCLDEMTKRIVAGSFNRITVDGDTSTNDAFIIAATGAAGHPEISDPDSTQAGDLMNALLEVARLLAQAIVRDGEGATKFVTVQVTGGGDEDECLEVAYTVAESPLVKTALFASDPNWGRLAMAIGRAEIEALDVSGVDVFFEDVQVMSGGVIAADYTEEAGAVVLAEAEFTIRIDLGRGGSRAEVWTSDLSYDYVRINAEYRT